MEVKITDGGRSEAGFKWCGSDCVCRAITIATNQSYLETYNALKEIGLTERTGKRKRGKSHPRTGIYKQTTHKYLKLLGWRWKPTMHIGSGCKVHLKQNELPSGRLIVQLSKHITAVIDGVIHDTHDPSRNGTRCVYGYWEKI